MNNLMKITRGAVVRRSALLLAAIFTPWLAQAFILGPYTPDANTLHLYHLDDSTTPVVDSATVAGSTNLNNLANSATLGNTAYSNTFNTCLSTLGGGQNSVGGANQAMVLEGTTIGTPISMTYANSISGAFTYEAILWVGFDPTLNYGTAGNGGNGRAASGGQCFILSCESNGTGSRVWQFRIDPIGVITSGFFTNKVALEFNNVSGSPDYFVAIPTNGPNAIVSNGWYHVAVTYNGVPNTTSNVLLYWTAMNPTNTQDNCIGGTNLPSGLSPLASASTVFTIGNSGRNPSGSTANALNGNFLGSIDEVRISSVARAADQMMFANTNVNIDTQPVSQTVVIGQPASFSVGVGGVPPFGYQWYESSDTSGDNPSPVLNATNATYSIAATAITDATNYFVIITNSYSVSATSTVATLSIRTSVNDLSWRGTNSANWDYTSPNWSNMVTAVNGFAYQTGDNVAFNDAVANRNINLTTEFFPSSVTNTANTNYILSGSGYLAGTMNLTKSGTGTLTISNANIFTGPVAINNGVVQLGNPNALGSASTSVTINGGTLDIHGVQGPANLNYYVQGTGYTNAGVIQNFSANNSQNGGGIASLTLQGDTTIGATTGRWDLNGDASGSTGLKGNGYNLTKIGGNQLWLIDAGTNNGVGNINITASTLGFQGLTDMGNPTKTVTVYSNAVLGFYAVPSTTVMNKNIVLTNALISISLSNLTLGGSVTLWGTDQFSEGSGIQVTFNGPISGSGIWDKTGAGTETFNGTNTYSGGTLVNAGTLVVGANSSLGSGSLVQLAPGATLDVSATPGLSFGSGQTLANTGNSGTAANLNGNVTNGPGSTLNSGVNGPGTLNINGNLTLSGGTNIVELGSDPTQDGNGVNDFINVSGNINLTNVNTIQIIPVAPLSASTYTIAFANAINGGLANLQVVSANPRYTLFPVNPSTTGGYLEITVSNVPSPLVWRGGKSPGPNVWNHSVTNWWNTGTTNFDRFYDADLVTFDDTSVTNLVNVTETNKPGYLLFNNNVTNYTFYGIGNLTGTLDQEGSNTVTLAISNAPGLNFITNNQGTLAFNLPLNATLNAAVSDNGSGLGTIMQAGTNTLVLAGNNGNYYGTFAVTNGVLQYTASTALGASTYLYATNGGSLDLNNVDTGTKTIAIAGAGYNGQGAMVDLTTTWPAYPYQIAHNITLVGNAAIGANARWDVTGGTFAGNGFNLTKVGGSQVTLVNVGGTGLGNVDIVGGNLTFQQNTDMGDPTKTLTVESNAVLGLWAGTAGWNKTNIVVINATISSGGSTNALVGPVTLQPGTNYLSTSVDFGLWGPISGAGGFIKQGGGTLWLYGTNTYSGSTVVGQSSTVYVDTNSSLGSSSTIEIDGGSALNVAGPPSFNLGNGQTMIGNGTVIGGNVNFGSGSTLAVGFSTASPETLTMSGNLALLSGSTNYVKVNKTTSIANDKVVSPTLVTMGGTLVITNLGNALAGGDAIPLFSATNYSGSFSSIVPATPGAGLAWNTNTLDSDGTLRVLVTVNLTPTNIVTQLSGNQLTLSWPVDHIGWRLQAQTNALSTGLGTNWVDLSGSSTTNQVIITINPTNGTVFYRMAY